MENSAQSKFNSHLHNESFCPICKHVLDAVTGDGEEGPADGDFSICFYCGEILRFEIKENTSLRTINMEDIQEIKDQGDGVYDQLYQYQRMVRLRIAQAN